MKPHPSFIHKAEHTEATEHPLCKTPSCPAAAVAYSPNSCLLTAGTATQH